MKEKKWAD